VPVPCVSHSVCLSVCLSDEKVYCDKMADWIQMLFGVVSGIGQGIGVLDGEWEFLFFFRSHSLHGVLTEMYSARA